MNKQAFTVAEVAGLTGFSRQTVTRIFEKERDVIILNRPEKMHKRKYRSIRIPRPVYERVIRKLSTAFLFLVALCAAQAPTDIQKMNDAEIKQHAAETVAHLHDSMLDPASFALDGVYVTKPNKRGKVSICYAFRSHNTMGGYSEARAVEDGDDKNRLSVFNHDNGYGKFQGYDVGWIAPCKDKSIDREITTDTAHLAPALYKKSR